MMTRTLSVLLLALSAGCEVQPDPYAAAVDAAVPTRMPAPPRTRWTSGLIEGGNVGVQPSVATAPDGTVAAAYFVVNGSPDATCQADDADAVRFELRYATFDASTSQWTAESVGDVLLLGQPVGLDLAFEPDGTPLIATLIGEPLRPPLVITAYCGAHDAGFYRRGEAGWTTETVVASSGEAATGDAASDFGEVVGQWPGLAVAADGTAFLAYKDVHAGSIQRDDRERADLEIATRRDGQWSTEAIDFGHGAGDYTTVVITQSGAPAVAWYNPIVDSPDRGLWVAVERGIDEWHRMHLGPGAATRAPSMAIEPETGALLVAWYDAERGRPMFARLDNPRRVADLEHWAIEALGDPVYDEGRHPSVAVDPVQGHVGIAYYRCTRASLGLGDCDPQHDAVVFTWFIEGAWEREIVDQGDTGPCGLDPALAFDVEGLPVVTYACTRRDASGGFELRMEWARRERLR
jgi:hypothetical protein